ncbi:putative SET domain-containing protein [Cotonvirus japonicus]|uniref:SET domain-containing protein n=1 Tax=Cotonvirus japonicus TaxID=2811091 RepID=A0ABM7NS33_9VIRU|nr:putative SET domain-containing protein [Cotonvirus japonicus]BCS82970.1 putative SET domain-containing protein [Cotonvirus japonicus]
MVDNTTDSSDNLFETTLNDKNHGEKILDAIDDKIISKSAKYNNDYICVIYQHPFIQQVTIDNFKSVTNTEDISIGELLLLEHVYVDNTTNCHLVIENNSDIFNDMYPRTTLYSETKQEERRIQSVTKLSSNCFGYMSNKLLTSSIQKINHSCTPNCAVNIRERYIFAGTHVVFMELFAIKNIKTGSPITINYGPETAHKRDFECDCGMDYDHRKKLFGVTCKLAKHFSDIEGPIIQNLVLDYVKTNLGNKILLNHYLAKHGIFFDKNTISAITPEGCQTINNVLDKSLNSKQKRSTKNKVGNLIMDQKKINLFLAIMNKILFDDRTKKN